MSHNSILTPEVQTRQTLIDQCNSNHPPFQDTDVGLMKQKAADAKSWRRMHSLWATWGHL